MVRVKLPLETQSNFQYAEALIAKIEKIDRKNVEVCAQRSKNFDRSCGQLVTFRGR